MAGELSIPTIVANGRAARSRRVLFPRPAAEVDGVLDLQMGNTREQVGRGAGTFSVKLQIQRRIPVGHRVQFLCEEGDRVKHRTRQAACQRLMNLSGHLCA